MDLIAADIETYVRAHTAPEDALRQALARETEQKTERPSMQTGPVEGALLRFLVHVSGAHRVLEIGTFTGYSALMMAEGLPGDGQLITCDINPDTTAIAKRYWAKNPHGAKIEARLGSALDTIKTLEGQFDFVFIDADKENYINYWEAVLPKVRMNGIIAVDNVLWSGRVLDPQAPSDHAIVKFNQHVRNDDRVEAVMLTVRDGVTLARKL